MAEDASTIKHEIELTRERIGAADDASGYEADAPARIKDAVQKQVEAVKGTISDVGADVPGSAQRAVGAIQENPIGLALAALSIGFLTGSLVPISAIERKRLQPIREKIIDQAQAATSDLMEAGKAVVLETAHTAVSSALSSAQAHGHEVVDAAKARAAQN